MASQSGEVQTVVQSLVGSFERRGATVRTHDSHLRKARAGHVVGGRTYGYNNEVVLGENGKKSHVRRVINQDQPAVVRRIFERYAAGHGITRIAKALNADGIAPPRTRRLGWAPTAVREILYRDLYRGLIVWDKLQKVVKRGTKTRRARPESEWTRVEAPALRIVDDALWDQVRERLDANQASYARVAGGKLRARPARVDLDSKYLLSGSCSALSAGTPSPRPLGP
jgi:site-specific DNA recombinase